MSNGTPKEYYRLLLFVDGPPSPYLLMQRDFGRAIRIDSSYVDQMFRDSTTGATTHLPNVCPACSDTYPDSALFCISCGARR